jgi:D-glycero-D-manno-heptose 1,7-bisphosphate phosphatase
MMQYVILDRDGTIIEERHYLSDPDEVRLLPNASAGLRRMRAAGWGLLVVTNQSAVGRGKFTEARLAEIHARMEALLLAEGVQLDGIYYCPHTPEDRCLCRKPATGLVERAAGGLGFNPAACVVIGDKRCDMDLGHRVGAKTILVRTGYGAREEEAGLAGADAIVDDLLAAFETISRWRRTP